MRSLKYDYFNSGQSNTLAILNSALSPIAIKKVVTLTGYDSSTRTITAEPISAQNQKPLGVALTPIAPSSRGDIVTVGVIDDIDTSMQSVGDKVFFDANGDIAFVGTSSSIIGSVTSVGVNGSVFINLGGNGGGVSFDKIGVKSANYSAQIGELVPCDTTLASFTVTLPNTVSDGDMVAVMDVGGNFSTNPLTITSTKKIMNDTEDLELDSSYTYLEFIFDSTSDSWFKKTFGDADGGGSDGLMYSPSVLTPNLLDGEYNDLEALVADIQILPIKNIYISENCTIDLDSFILGGNHNLENYSIIGKRKDSSEPISLVITSGIPNTDLSANNGHFFSKIENLNITFTESFIFNANQTIEFIDSTLRLDDNFTLRASATGQNITFNLKNSRFEKEQFTNSYFLGLIDTGVVVNSYYGNCHIDDDFFYAIGSLTHNEYGAFDDQDGRKYPVIGNQPSGFNLIPTQNNYKTIDQIEGNTVRTTQVSNTFFKGDPVYFDGTNWVLADASDIRKVATGVVKSVENGGKFEVAFNGQIEFTASELTEIIGTSTMMSGATYYLAQLPTGIPLDGSVFFNRYVTLSPAISQPIFKSISPTKAIIQFGITASSNGGGSSIVQETFTSTLNQTTFTLTTDTLGKAYTWVTLDGVEETAFTISGKNVVLSSPLPSGVSVSIRYVKYFKLDTRNNIIRFRYVATAGQTSFPLDVTPENVDYLLVLVDGAWQSPISVGGSFSLVGNVLTFDTPLALGVVVSGAIINAVNFDVSFDNYITRKLIELPVNGVTTVNTIFGENLNAEYRIKASGNPIINATAWVRTGASGDADIFTISPHVNGTFGNSGTLNIDFNSGTLRIQNRTTDPLQLVVIREL